MTGLTVIVIMILLSAGLPICFLVGYREGHNDGYGSGYADRDNETLYGEKPGTRRKERS